MKETARAFLVAIASTLVAVGAGAQVRPDFTGEWQLAPNEGPRAWKSRPDEKVPTITIWTPAARPSFGTEFTARQDAGALTIERRIGKNLVTTVYRLDGSESQNEEGRFKTVSLAHWEEDKLVIVTRLSGAAEGQENELRRVLRAGADGTLIVDMTLGREEPEVTVYRRRARER